MLNSPEFSIDEIKNKESFFRLVGTLQPQIFDVPEFKPEKGVQFDKELQKAFAKNPDSIQLNERQAAYVSVCRQMFSFLISSAQLHEQLSSALPKLENAFLAELVKDQRFWFSSEHPCRQFFDKLHDYGQGWHPDVSDEVPSFAGRLVEWVDRINEKRSWYSVISEIGRYAADHEEITSDAAKEELVQFIDSESASVNSMVIKMINQEVAGKALPFALVSYIQKDLVRDLVAYIISKHNKKIVARWQRILKELVDVFDENNGQDKETLFAINDEIKNKLIEGLKKIGTPDDSAYKMVGEYDMAMVKLLMGQKIDNVICAQMEDHTPLKDTVASSTASDVSVAPEYLEQVKSFRLGQWFDGMGDYAGRFKLSLKQEAANQLYLSDINGALYKQVTFQQFALALSLNQFVVLNPSPITKFSTRAFIHNLIDSLTSGKAVLAANDDQTDDVDIETLLSDDYKGKSVKRPSQPEASAPVSKELQNLQALIAKAEARAKQQGKISLEQDQIDHLIENIDSTSLVSDTAIRRREHDERKQLIQDQQKDEVKKNLQRNEDRLKARAAVMEAEREKQRLEEEKAALHQRIMDLPIGAWAVIKKDGVDKKCKLSVKMASTQKYVFVDELGLKAGQYILDELLDLSDQGLFEIVDDNDLNFDTRLANVVKGMRGNNR